MYLHGKFTLKGILMNEVIIMKDVSTVAAIISQVAAKFVENTRTVMQEKGFTFALMREPAIHKSNFTLTVKFGTGRKVQDTSSMTIQPADVGITPKEWENYWEIFQMSDGVAPMGDIKDLNGGHLSLRDIFRVPWIATNRAAYHMETILDVINKRDYPQEYSLFYQELTKHVTGAVIAEITRITALDTDELCERGDASVGESDYVFTRGNMVDEGEDCVHFTVDIEPDGNLIRVPFSCPDAILNSVDFEYIREIVHIYGNVFVACLLLQPQPCVETGGCTISLVEKDYKFERNTESMLDWAMRKSIGKMTADMMRRLQRVNSCLPYLAAKGIKPVTQVNGTPVFEFQSKNNNQKIYIGMTFMLVHEIKEDKVQMLVDTSKTDPLDKLETMIKAFGITPMLVFVQCIFLNRKLPDFEKLMQKK